MEITRNQFCLFIYVWPLVLFIPFNNFFASKVRVKPCDLRLCLFSARKDNLEAYFFPHGVNDATDLPACIIVINILYPHDANYAVMEKSEKRNKL